MFSLDQGMAHGGAGRLGTQVAVAFDDAFKMGMREDEHGAVFALNERVAAAGGGVDAGEIAEVKTGDIHGMDKAFKHEQAGHLGKVGLIGVRMRPEAIVVHHREVVSDRVADDAFFDDVLQFALPGLPAPVFMNHDGDGFGGDEIHHLFCGGKVRGKGLLDDDGKLVFEAELEQRHVAIRASGDIDEIKFFRSEHGGRVSIGAGRRSRGAGDVGVAGGNDLGFRHAAPGLELDLSKEAAADEGATQGFRTHASHDTMQGFSMNGIPFAAIADDFTGGSDLAGMLTEAGARTVLVFGEEVPELEGVDAVVVCLKSRSIAAEQARAMTRRTWGGLQKLKPRQVQFKYCSTFDSTVEGNIGPAIEELLDLTGAPYTVAVPALPVNGRTQYLGHLFVNGVLLNESPMRQHPLNPMEDANLVRFFQEQCGLQAGLVDLSAVRRRQVAERMTGAAQVYFVDATEEEDLRVIAEAVKDFPLITGGSGLGRYLPAWWGVKAVEEHASEIPEGRRTLILSGSCSAATLEQLEVSGMARLPVNVDAQVVREEIERVGVALVSSSAAAEDREQGEGVSLKIEHQHAEWARRAVEQWGVRQVIVAGG